jgi:hypothetical protein
VQTKKKSISKLSKKINGTWKVVAIYDGPCADGPYKPNTIWKVSDYGFEVTIKNNRFCTTHWEDPIQEGKPHCEKPLIFFTDNTFTGMKGGRFYVYGGFMKLNGSRLEFYEEGMGGYTKYVLSKKR